jgi:fructose-1,6-bisphosphatase I
MRLEETFMHFLLRHQMRNKRTLNFIILMQSVLTAARYIEMHYSEAALEKKLGSTGNTNVQGEAVMELDIIAHQIVMHYLLESKQVIQAVSEEVVDRIDLTDDGRYYFYFDPVDGSSNIKHNLPVGFLFGIAKTESPETDDRHLRKGIEFIASGVFLIPTGVFTFALKDAGAWQFILDKEGDFIRPTRLVMPTIKDAWELSYNVANLHTFSDKIRNFLMSKQEKLNFRYAGSLAVDFHRLLHTGGMFAYPAIINHPNKIKNKPEGKLRLMYEAAVIAFIANQAGAKAVNENGQDILAVQPEHHHQRSTLFVGNPELIDEFVNQCCK